MNLEIVTVSEIRERKIPYGITYRSNLKKKKKNRKTKEVRDKLGIWD